MECELLGIRKANRSLSADQQICIRRRWVVTGTVAFLISMAIDHADDSIDNLFIYAQGNGAGKPILSDIEQLMVECWLRLFLVVVKEEL